MAGVTYYARRQFLDWLSGKGDPPASVDRYLALFTAAPSDAGGGTECSGGDYARASIPAAMPYADALASDVVNTAPVTFNPAVGAWGTITHVGVYDAPTGGNLLTWATLPSSLVIGDGDQLTAPAGVLTVSVAS